MVSFYDWLVDQHYRQDFVGELGQLAKLSPQWPKGVTYQSIRVFLARYNATERVFYALDLAYGEWQLTRHLPSINCIPLVKLNGVRKPS